MKTREYLMKRQGDKGDEIYNQKNLSMFSIPTVSFRIAPKETKNIIPIQIITIRTFWMIVVQSIVDI